MQSITRRSLLAAAAAAPPALLAAGKFSAPLNVQLYTVRDILPKDARGVIFDIAKIGYASVEPGRAQLAQLAPICKEAKLTTPSVHLETPLVTGSWDAWKELKASAPKDLAQAIDESTANGAKFLVVSYLQKAERTVPGFYEKFADQMNSAGEQCRKAGLQLCYHHHSFEFAPTGGKRPFDILVAGFDKKSVKFQLDVFWLSIAGEDPAAMLRRLKGRVASVHLKDIAAGTATEYDEAKVPRPAFKEAGNGTMQWAAVLDACKDAGVKQYIVEQDQCAGSPIDSLRQSYNFLRSL